MIVINERRVVVFSYDELKDVLEGIYDYSYIYLGNDIEIMGNINLSSDKKEIIICGTYLNYRHTLTLSDYGFNVDKENERVVIRNVNIESSNTNGVIYAPLDSNYRVITEYNDVIFEGVILSYNPYGTTKIIDCTATIKSRNGVNCRETCQSDNVIIGGRTSVNNETNNATLFIFSNNWPSFTILENSRVDISSTTKAFMNGTNKLNFSVLHDAEFNLITGDGFAAFSLHGAYNVLIDERASFVFIEKSHQRVPMWNIYGNLEVNEGANFQVINTYESTPSDNYNLYFRGSNQSMIFNNPKCVVLYNKNAPGIYASSDVNFAISVSRINMWSDSVEVSMAGSLDNLPLYSWYKESGLMYLSGTFNSTGSSIDVNNLTSDEMLKLPLIENFIWTGKKMLSMGNTYMNINPIDSSSNKICGYTIENSDVLIEYNGSSMEVSAGDTGLFEYNLSDSLSDNTEIKITSNAPGSFIYMTRIVTVPFDGELSLIKANDNISFSFEPISNTMILPKKEELLLTIIDSRLVSSKWKLYVHLSGPLTSDNGYTLSNAVIFKGIDDVEIKLNEVPTLVFTGQNNGGDTLVTNVTWSKEKGILLDMTDNYLEVNEEYSTKVIWNTEE